MPLAVIFDVDGTLIDSVPQHAKAWQDAFRDFGYDIPFEDLRRQIGKGGDLLRLKSTTCRVEWCAPSKRQCRDKAGALPPKAARNRVYFCTGFSH